MSTQLLADSSMQLTEPKSPSGSLPVITSIDQVAVGTPCQMDWGLMDQVPDDERIRFCQHCTKNVYNISEMRSDEAIELINAKEGELCIRYFRRNDGTIVTADCPPINRRSNATGMRRWFQFSMASLLALLTASAGLCAAAPWIGTKIQPLVDRWFPAEEVQTFTAVKGDMVFLPPPIAPAPNASGEMWQGGFGGLRENIAD